jgi:hypothetical protein
MFSGFSLIETALECDEKIIVTNPLQSEFGAQSYGCGCFVFQTN